MEHLGIDVRSRESQVCIRDGAGEIVEEIRCRTAHLERHQGVWCPRRARRRFESLAWRNDTRMTSAWSPRRWCGPSVSVNAA